MHIEFVRPSSTALAETALAVVVFEDEVLASLSGGLAESASAWLARALAATRFRGARDQLLDLPAPGGLEAARLLLVGAGPRHGFDALAAEDAAARAYGAVKLSGLGTLVIQLPQGAAGLAAHAALGVRLGAYRFDRYRTKEIPGKIPSIGTVEIIAPSDAPPEWTALSALANGVCFARDLASEPPNILYPAEFARRVKALETLGLEVEVLGEPEMRALGMGALLGVGQGSARESQLVVIRWTGAADKTAPPVAFVGKGVCFDSGGISLKPADHMEDMKWDMGGAGAVAGLMHVLAGRKAKVNAVGVLGLVENMPDGAAQRPGDVVTSLSGQTIEIINTDAEGRLVLADALWYCQDRFKPRAMVDLATLTGAMITALGHDHAGCFSNDDQLARDLLAASAAEGEPLWRMPLPDAYDKQLDSMVADMKNLAGRPAGAITAALFLQRFVRGLPWAHLDIAPTAWKTPSSVATVPEGATGFGVRLLNRLVQDRYED